MNRPKQGPLTDLRVLDLTRVWSGPLATRLLADMGADVIKVEDPRLAPARPGGFRKLNRNKQSIALDLNDSRAVNVFKGLVAISDVVIENFRPRVMRNFGLEYDVLNHINPAIIVVALSGFGSHGPYADYPAFGPSVESLTGLSSLMGYPGGPPMGTAIAFPDAVGALNATAAVMTALWQRRETGRGQFIDLSQSEGPVCQLGEVIIGYQYGRAQPGRMGNSHPVHAPYGCYPCRAEDSWIAICVTSEAHWESLSRMMGSPPWTREENYAEPLSRWHHRQELDSLIADWTSNHDAQALMHQLQQGGVPAGAVLTNKDMLEDPHLNQREAFVAITEPEGVTYRYPGLPIHFSNDQEGTPLRHAPQLSEHARPILGALLGMTSSEIDELEARGGVGKSAGK